MERGAEFAVLPHLDNIVVRDDQVVVETSDGSHGARYLIGRKDIGDGTADDEPEIGPVREVPPTPLVLLGVVRKLLRRKLIQTV